MNGGNFAVNGNGNVSFNVANGGDARINANQYEGQRISLQPILIKPIEVVKTVEVIKPVPVPVPVEQPRPQPVPQPVPHYMDEANRAMRDAAERGYLLI